VALKKKYQAEKAYTELRRLLLGHTIEQGKRLTEQACAETLDVNRGDVRQALARLHSEGLLTRGEKGGYFVPEISETELDQITEVRLIFESSAVKLAVHRATEDDLRDLQQICDDMDMMASRGYKMGVNEADVRFHETLVRAVHNPKLSQLYRLANFPISFAKPFVEHPDQSILFKNVAHHRALLDAFKNKNAQKVIDLLYEGVNKIN
jgi:DNA-binding GntR family transcriptional regulator